VSLQRPIALRPNPNRPGTYLYGQITQPFDGDYDGERPGYVRFDLPVKRGKRSWFPRSRKKVDFHGGIDYRAPEGTPLFAVHDGTVIEQGKYWYTGEVYCIIQIKVGRIYKLAFLYTHMKAGSFKFKVGDRVRKGDVIGRSGNTGWSTGPHLHAALIRLYRWQKATFSNCYNGMYMDPEPFMGNDGWDLTRIV